MQAASQAHHPPLEADKESGELPFQSPSLTEKEQPVQPPPPPPPPAGAPWKQPSPPTLRWPGAIMPGPKPTLSATATPFNVVVPPYQLYKGWGTAPPHMFTDEQLHAHRADYELSKIRPKPMERFTSLELLASNYDQQDEAAMRDTAELIQARKIAIFWTHIFLSCLLIRGLCAGASTRRCRTKRPQTWTFTCP
jgi:hypothetical protein